jgi:hypothetical protein
MVDSATAVVAAPMASANVFFPAIEIVPPSLIMLRFLLTEGGAFALLVTVRVKRPGSSDPFQIGFTAGHRHVRQSGP